VHGVSARIELSLSLTFDQPQRAAYALIAAVIVAVAAGGVARGGGGEGARTLSLRFDTRAERAGEGGERCGGGAPLHRQRRRARSDCEPEPAEATRNR